MIEIKNISKKFVTEKVEQTAIKNINLNIRQGEFITIMGPSGGGKSTLLNIVGLLMEPTSGEIYFNNTKVNFNNENELDKYRRDNIGLIFQNANLISCLDPVENLIVPMNNNLNKKEKIEKAKELLERVGLKRKEHSNVSSLSEGEAQRVAIVRSLVNNPKVILCDEPTGALDTVNGEKVINLLLDIKKENNCTLIIVTHDKKIGELGERQLYIQDDELHELV